MVILSAGSPPSEMGMNTRNTMSSGYPNEVNIPLRIGRRPVRNSGREMGVGEGGGGGEGDRKIRFIQYSKKLQNVCTSDKLKVATLKILVYP